MRRIYLLLAVTACRADTESVMTRASGTEHISGSGGLSAPGSGGELPVLVEHGGLSFEIVDDATGERSPAS